MNYCGIYIVFILTVKFKGDKMKNLFIATLTLIVFTIFFTGCYTQLGAVKSESRQIVEEDYSYEQEDNYSDYDTTYTEGNSGSNYENYDYSERSWYPRPRWSFSYYYPSYYWPSVAFGYVYNDPWFYDRYWYYDPWICGTPWIYYPAYYYPSFYYPPYYTNYWWSDNYYVTSTGTVTKTRRDFGSSRDNDKRGNTAIDDRTDRMPTRSGYDLPTGVGVTGSGGRSAAGKTSDVQRPSRGTSSSREVAPRGSDRSRRSDSPSSGSRRERYERTDRGQSTPPASGPSRGSESTPRRDDGTSTRTYTPPPSAPAPSAPAPSSPPPSRGGDSRGGSNDNNQGSRGGSNRGGR